MILIISDDIDHSTNEVIKWLKLWKKPYLRVGQNNFINSIYLSINNNKVDLSIKIGQIELNYDQITSFWYRKHFLELFKDFDFNHSIEFDKSKWFKFLQTSELLSLNDYLIFLLEKKCHIGNYHQRNANKLISFYNAEKSGLKIPETIISSDINFFENCFNNKKSVIKPIQDLFITEKNNFKYYTNILKFNRNTLRKFESKIFPSCIQKYVRKKIELRVFYLDGECYSMAIFSQMDNQTKLDFRNYNFSKPNRCVPYNIDESLKIKIVTFMNFMNLNTGSLDFILTPKNEYVFLEVNPSGQYGMIEYNCFYSLDRKIAEKLIHKL
jgi:ATP-GRASP peptide maturase of grasp-with-spasm system